MKTALYPPGPRPRLLGSLLWAFRKDPTGTLTNLAREYGDIVHLKVGRRHVYLLNHPDFIKDVLVTNHRLFSKGPALKRSCAILGNGLLTSEGEQHARQRRWLQPAFQPAQVATYSQPITTCVARLSRRWQDGRTVDMAYEMRRLVLEIVAAALFENDLAEDDLHTITQTMDTLDQGMNELDFVLIQSPISLARWLGRLSIPSTRRLEQARNELDAILSRLLIKKHFVQPQEDAKDRNNLLSLLYNNYRLQNGHSDEKTVRDQALTILLAGLETIANALTWTWYLLSHHSPVEDQLHQELADVLHGRLPTGEDIERLPYAKMVLSESLRLYPPAWVIGRQAQENCQVGGYEIPCGAILLMSQWVMHHDARYYPNPFRFDPLRWMPGAQAQRPHYAYFPFGGGPRACLGESFAWMEGVLSLATLAQAWQVRLVPNHPVALQAHLTLRPKHGMCMILKQRPFNCFYRR